LTAFIAINLIPFLISIRPRRGKETGFRYIYVNDDGSARELTDDEQDYINTKFEGGDGARPYIKSHYYSLTPDKKMKGFLWRRHLPRKITIESAPKGDSVTQKY
jgi:hypothetical protein